jgi:hypothetical protein
MLLGALLDAAASEAETHLRADAGFSASGLPALSAAVRAGRRAARRLAAHPARRPHCAPCRAAFCTTCQGRGGQRGGCPVAAGRGRSPRLARGLVSEAAVYARAWSKAVRAATRICGQLAAEDAVQAAALYLWDRRERLEAISVGLFLLAVKQRANHERLTAWRRHAGRSGPTSWRPSSVAAPVGS